MSVLQLRDFLLIEVIPSPTCTSRTLQRDALQISHHALFKQGLHPLITWSSGRSTAGTPRRSRCLIGHMSNTLHCCLALGYVVTRHRAGEAERPLLNQTCAGAPSAFAERTERATPVCTRLHSESCRAGHPTQAPPSQKKKRVPRSI